MPRLFHLISSLCLLLVVAAPLSAAETPKVLTWEGLIPQGPPVDNPYQYLPIDQQVELEMLATIRAQVAAGLMNEVHPMFEDAREIEFKLRQEGIDVDRMVGLVQKMQSEVAARNSELAHDLDGQLVRLPGYVLPLEFEGTSVKEFLLVPYVGACIHVPPPPINQTVVVHLNQSYAAKELYEPVWVTGRMTVKRSKRALTLVDGDADVEAGYTIQGTRVEPYTEK
ncbi:MAG TPA: hypothetical protein DIW51_17235 [Rhodospirillaceae bacterium]|jgi:hypothetical protein|nr:hypothetical protein [Magnetovibrio sp.]HCS71705.1 hypothetical protein [Rhodospirillaceae bacterium]|tara:strand:+ start:290 stop:964 length:675 start_codon:yes stop_codon:yes gene_type:complete